MEYNFNIIKGNILDYIGKVDAVCVTTNGVIKANGELVMGADDAKAFYDKYNGLFNIATILAQKLYRKDKLPYMHVVDKKDNICYRCVSAEQNNGTNIISFPVKSHFQDKSDLELIEQSAKRLLWIANHYKLNSIVLSSPGTGYGQLLEDDVYDTLNKYFDKRFYIIKK